MPSKDKRVRVERGLYRTGQYFYACATPRGSRSVVWRSLGPIGIMEARRLRDKLAAEVQGDQLPATRTRATFGELAMEWLAEQQSRVDVGELSPRTYEGYELALRRHVLPAFGQRQLRSITVDELAAWIRRLRAGGYSPYSVQNYWAPARLTLRHAVRHGLLASSPADRLTSSERPKQGPSRQRFLDKHEIEQLLAWTPERYRVALACGLFAGLRLSEVLGLVWGDVDFRGHTLRVRNQLGRDGRRRPLKTAAARRDVMLMHQLAGELRRIRMASAFSGDRDPVLCTATGTPLGHRNLTRRGLKKAATDAGLDGVTFHVLRHTFASIIIAQGCDPVFASRQLGHANPAITLKVYAHLFDAARHGREAREGLEAEYGHLLLRDRP